MGTEPLASWNGGAAKSAILGFVARVTAEGGPDFVPPADRIAVLDNDGTLWCERPAYVQAMFILERLHEQAEADPELARRPVVQALLAGDLGAAHAAGAAEMAHVLLSTHAGLTAEEFAAVAARWLAGHRSGRRGDRRHRGALWLDRGQHARRLGAGLRRATVMTSTVTVTERDMAWIAGATFLMGSDNHYAEEAPAHRVAVDGFWIDRCAVTNRQFAAFARATGYVTVAERPPDPADFPGAPPENLCAGSLVFTPTRGPVDLKHLDHWWTWTPGASWRHPEGPGSTLAGRMDHPVVHIAYDDAHAYATWAQSVLPSEAEWELAARGGLEGATFTWGDEPEPSGQRLANFWHGDFPWRADLGYGTTAAVGSFQPNGYGLHDMAGNVWEWTEDWYASRHQRRGTTEPAYDRLSRPSMAQGVASEHRDDVAKPCCIPCNPRGAEQAASLDPAQLQFRVPRKVLKGGSFLCADSYCLRYRPAARRPQMVDTGMSHVGFRCVRRTGVERTDRTQTLDLNV